MAYPQKLQYELTYLEETGQLCRLRCNGMNEIDAASKLKDFSGHIVHIYCLGLSPDPQPYEGHYPQNTKTP